MVKVFAFSRNPHNTTYIYKDVRKFDIQNLIIPEQKSPNFKSGAKIRKKKSILLIIEQVFA